MSELHVYDHPLIQHKLSILRDKNTSLLAMSARMLYQLVGSSDSSR